MALKLSKQFLISNFKRSQNVQKQVSKQLLYTTLKCVKTGSFSTTLNDLKTAKNRFLYKIKFLTLKYFQEQFITIMTGEVPILINIGGPQEDCLSFKIFPLQNKVKVFHRRQKTFDVTEKREFQDKKHETLDPRKGNAQNRYRRVSSSGGKNKFPKDFFKDKLPSTPVKSRFNNSNKQNITESLSFCKPQLQDQKVYSCKKQTKKYQIQSPQIKCEQVNQQQTPKFNQKNLSQNQLFQPKAQRTQRKTNMQQYLSSKKESFPIFFKSQKQSNLPVFDSLQQNKLRSLLKHGKQQAKNDILLQTLGKILSLLKKDSKTCTKISIRRKVSNSQKQNCQQTILMHKKKNKNIEEFLQTKGLNYKMLQKINNLNFKLKQQNNLFFRNWNQNQKLSNLGMRKGCSQKYEQPQRNTFRVRKYV